MNDQMTALEIARRANAPDPFHIIELMGLTNEMLLDVPAHEANNGIVNVTLQRAIKPMGEHRVYNQGVGNAATQTKIVHDRIAMLAEYSTADAAMLEHSGNIPAARMSEAAAIIKGMGLTQAETLIYGDGAKAEEFDGLFKRRNSLADKNVVDAGGTGSNLTSIYVCALGPDLFHLIYPKGASGVGVSREDLGRIHVQDPADAKKTLPVYRDYFTAQYGISVRAPEAVKRICNIPANIDGNDLIDILMETRHRMPPGAATYVMYANVEMLIKLDKAARDKANVVYNAADPWGKPITYVRDMRCRRMDVILSAEAQVA
jgi:hypothetical protein